MRGAGPAAMLELAARVPVVGGTAQAAGNLEEL
jgi:hypothetical protein